MSPLLTPWHMFIVGGPFMWPILACSITGATLILLKAFQFAHIERESKLLVKSVTAELERNSPKSALHLCSSTDVPVARILRPGLLQYGRTKNTICASMLEAASVEIPTLETGFIFMATIPMLAILFGFLGTTLGLMDTFRTLQGHAALLNPLLPSKIAENVWHTLIPTAAGLTIAIPVAIMHNFLIDQLRGIVLDMQSAALSVSNLMVRTDEHPPSEQE